MRIRYAVPIVIFLLLMAVHVSAKGQAERIILTGPEIEGEMLLTERGLVMALTMGSLEDFTSGVIGEPLVKSDLYYDLERQIHLGSDRFQTLDRVRFYPGAGSQTGYVHYLGLDNGWTEYDDKWFFARPEAVAAFNTAFDTNARPYLVLMPGNGHILIADPVTLEDVTDIAVLAFDTRIDEVNDGPDAGTLYVTTHDAGFTQHYRISLADRTVCWADVLPPAARQPAGSLWNAGAAAQTLSDNLQGTWLEPIAERNHTHTALLYHPLGRYHNYDYGAEDRGEIPGGILIYSYDRQPVMRDHWQANKRFAQVIAGDEVLYAIEAPRGEERVELYALDATNGDILNSRILSAGRWNIGYGIFDLSGVKARASFRLADRCQYNMWEIPQVWRMPQALAAGS